MRYDDDDLLEDGVDDWINSPEESGAVEDQVMKKKDIKYRQGRNKKQVENSYKAMYYGFILLMIVLTLTTFLS